MDQSHKFAPDISWFGLNPRPTPVPTSDTRMGFPLTRSWSTQEPKTDTLSLFLHNPKKKGYPQRNFLQVPITDGQLRQIESKLSQAKNKNGLNNFSLSKYK